MERLMAGLASEEPVALGLHVYCLKTHFVSTVHQFFFALPFIHSGGIFAIRIVEQVESSYLPLLSFLP